MKRKHEWIHAQCPRLIGLILGGLLLLPGATQGAMDTWVGLGANDNWITLGNWSDGSPPLATDAVTFNAGDSGNTSIVNTDFTLLGLRYMGNGTHTTDFAGSSHLQVDGPVYVGYGGSTDGATVTWTNGGSLTIGDSANLRQFYIGYNDTAGATNISSLTINGPHVDAFLSTLAIAPNYSTGGQRAGAGQQRTVARGNIVLSGECENRVQRRPERHEHRSAGCRAGGRRPVPV
jgi:hypothetical protein